MFECGFCDMSEGWGIGDAKGESESSVKFPVSTSMVNAEIVLEPTIVLEPQLGTYRNVFAEVAGAASVAGGTGGGSGVGGAGGGSGAGGTGEALGAGGTGGASGAGGTGEAFDAGGTGGALRSEDEEDNSG
jgi:hypothetical protein